MKQTFLFLSLLTFLFFSCTDDRDISTEPVVVNPESVIVHYWNFNTLSGTVTSIPPDFSLLPFGTEITYPGTGDGYMDNFDPGYALNARNGDVEGSGFRARNPSNTRNVLLSLPTTGYKTIVVHFATARTSAGATTQNYSYTIDGTNFINTGLATSTFTPMEDPTSSLVTLDFSAIPGVEDNPDFQIKIGFAGDAASGATGNNRFDNLTLEGIPTASGPGPGPIDDTIYLFQYWNFNALPSGTLTSVTPDASLISGNTAAITYDGSGAGYMDSFSLGSAENAQNTDVAGSGLRARNPSNTRNLMIAAPTTGYKDVVVRFATAKSSGAGASMQNYSYSLDGTNFITTNLPVATFNPDSDPAYAIVTLDFSAISGANDNPAFVLKISFAGAEATGSSGNNRFDNITFQGKHL